MSREKVGVKIRMCEFLGVKPVFIVRAAPKTYNFMVFEKGGYAWIYEAQIYPPGHEGLAESVQTSLGLPVVCSYGIPSGMVDRFLKWHGRQVKR